MWQISSWTENQYLKTEILRYQFFLGEGVPSIKWRILIRVQIILYLIPHNSSKFIFGMKASTEINIKSISWSFLIFSDSKMLSYDMMAKSISVGFEGTSTRYYGTEISTGCEMLLLSQLSFPNNFLIWRPLSTVMLQLALLHAT